MPQDRKFGGEPYRGIPQIGLSCWTPFISESSRSRVFNKRLDHHKPHLEAFRDKGYEVLFFTDPVDELWLRLDRQFQGKKLVSVAARRFVFGRAECG